MYMSSITVLMYKFDTVLCFDIRLFATSLPTGFTMSRFHKIMLNTKRINHFWTVLTDVLCVLQIMAANCKVIFGVGTFLTGLAIMTIAIFIGADT